MVKKFLYILLCFLFFSCSEKKTKNTPKNKASYLVLNKSNSRKKQNTMPDSIHFKNIANIAPSIIQDIKYADTTNFTKKQIYACPACFLQTKAAYALKKAQVIAQSLGYSLKVFDCYRPHDYQIVLFNAFPNINYVAHPSKGSQHSLGCAVDLTLVTKNETELDMGTHYDSFKKKSYTYSSLIDSAQKYNRSILIDIMNQVGFRAVKTEWWHFSFRNCEQDIPKNMKWSCE